MFLLCLPATLNLLVARLRSPLFFRISGSLWRVWGRMCSLFLPCKRKIVGMPVLNTLYVLSRVLTFLWAGLRTAILTSTAKLFSPSVYIWMLIYIEAVLTVRILVSSAELFFSMNLTASMVKLYCALYLWYLQPSCFVPSQMYCLPLSCVRTKYHFYSQAVLLSNTTVSEARFIWCVNFRFYGPAVLQPKEHMATAVYTNCGTMSTAELFYYITSPFPQPSCFTMYHYYFHSLAVLLNVQYYNYSRAVLRFSYYA